jgi:formate-dependent nitrite reductase membrane component NrfD
VTSVLKAPAAPLHRLAQLVEATLRQADNGLDGCADVICRKVLRIKPAPVPPRELNDPTPEANLDIEVQRAYRHDTLWAIPPMWWEMALGGVGAATFTASAATGSVPGMCVGWTLGAGGKGALLLLDLGRPERVWRVFAKPGASWIARGSWAFAAFAVGGAAAIGLRLVGAKTPANVAAATAAAASAVVVSYDGFFLNRSAAVSGWESPYLPGLFAANAAVAGTVLTGALTQRPTGWLSAGAVAAAAATAGLASAHLDNLKHSDAAARMTRDELVEGVQQPNFVLGGGAIGTLLPALLALLGAGTRSRTAWWLAATLSSLGVLLSRKAVLKSGIHAPVI